MVKILPSLFIYRWLNGINKTHEEFVEEIAIKNPNIEIIGIYISSKDKVKCKCKIHEYEWSSIAAELSRGKGCPVCCGKRLFPGYNDVSTLAPWMIPYFQGGVEEARKYSRTSTKKIRPKCPDCGRIKDKAISVASIYYNHSIGCICSDGISYPNKFGYALLEQLPVNNLINEYSPDWARPYRYDFYFEYKNKKYIIEMDGGLGHGKKLWDHSQDIQGLEKDKLKENMAKEHDIDIIRIDATYSRKEYIKKNILKNIKFMELFNENVNLIDWEKCDILAQKSFLKEVCDYWESGTYKVSDLEDIFHVNKETIRNYLKKGEELGFCNYYSKIKKHIPDAQPVLCNNKYAFSSKNSLIKKSEDLFGVKLNKKMLSNFQDNEMMVCDLNINLISLDDFYTYKKENPELCFV